MTDNIDGAIRLLVKSQKNSSVVLFMLGSLYKKQKEYSKAEEYYLKAMESGNNDALFNLGFLYNEQKEYSKAEEYYLKAIESGNNDALNNLSWLYFEQALNINKAIMLASKNYKEDKDYYAIHCPCYNVVVVRRLF